ncbi:MAG: hypothetical protein JKX88_07165 [Marinicaulis sp.]|nr:hypothetical protein [Marinicaulis sp.]
MDERLRQIWSGFEATTTRSLTGGGIDNIAVPHRTDFAAKDTEFLPDEFEAPAHAAFTALREGLARKEKMFSRKKKSKGASFSAEEEGPGAMTTRRFDGDELIKGLKATAMRTERTERDYQSFLSSKEGKAMFKKHKKKKRFGLF